MHIRQAAIEVQYRWSKKPFIFATARRDQSIRLPHHDRSRRQRQP